jgi:hypothetical protein
LTTRPLLPFLSAAAIAATLVLAPTVAHATANACAPNAAVGSACRNAGPNENQGGICDLTAASYAAGCVEAGDGGTPTGDAGDAGGPTCLTCVVTQEKGCGNEGPGGLSGAAFMPTVAGCCSIAGRSPWSGGTALVVAATCLALLTSARRRRRSR